MSKGILLIVFAWAMEIVGVAGGVVNSTYTTFGDDLPNTFAGYLPAVPMSCWRWPNSVAYLSHRYSFIDTRLCKA